MPRKTLKRDNDTEAPRVYDTEAQRRKGTTLGSGDGRGYVDAKWFTTPRQRGTEDRIRPV